MIEITIIVNFGVHKGPLSYPLMSFESVVTEKKVRNEMQAANKLHATRKLCPETWMQCDDDDVYI